MATKADLERLQGETRLQTAIVVAVQIVAFLILRFLPQVVMPEPPGGNPERIAEVVWNNIHKRLGRPKSG